MKNDIQDSCIEIPVPIDLYVALLDRLRKLDTDCAPATMVTSIVQEYLDGAPAARHPGSGKLGAPVPDWSDDWIMFGTPPAVAKTKAPKPRKNPARPEGGDWCIGCACPSDDLVSS